MFLYLRWMWKEEWVPQWRQETGLESRRNVQISLASDLSRLREGIDCETKGNPQIGTLRTEKLKGLWGQKESPTKPIWRGREGY